MMNLGIYSTYLSDPDIAGIISESAFINKMLKVEIALAKAQAMLGVIPDSAAIEIEAELKHFAPEPHQLTSGTLSNGIPMLPLLSLAKRQLSSEAADYLHYGATSQDIIDTATVLMIREVIDVMDGRLRQIADLLRSKAAEHEHTYMVARTRTQQAIPISFGLKVHGWMTPLYQHLDRLQELKPRVLKVQFGGAGGSLSALESDGWKIARALATELEINHSGVWHSLRDSICELSNWMAMVSGSLGKMAQDILLLSQTEVGELIENGIDSGSSSTMPHKTNPVLSEAIVALSRYVSLLACGTQSALIHHHERDATAWIIEWLTLPQTMICTGTILAHATTIATHMVVCTDAMTANLEKTNGLIYSEQAIVILTKYLSRNDAKLKITEACKKVSEEGVHFSEALHKVLPELDINWIELLQAKNYQGSTKHILNQDK